MENKLPATNHRLGLPWVGLLCCIFSLLGCEENPAEDFSFASAEVRIAPLVDSVMATGRVHTVTSVNISSQLSGRVDEVYVDFNDRVERGQRLARLDPQRFQSRVDELTAALALAEAELEAVAAALEGAQAKFDEDQRDHNRKLNLSGKGSVSASEVSRANAVKSQSASALKVKQASQKTRTAAVAAAMDLLASSTNFAVVSSA